MDNKVVLFVDDEENILKSIRRLLFDEEYELILTDSAKEALLILDHQDVHVIVSDQSMPEMSGIKFLQEVKNRHADTIRVILSGHVDVDLIVEAVNQGEVYRYLTKPWKDEDLIVTIRQCLEHYDILEQNRALSEKVKFQNEELLRMNEKLAEEVNERTRYLQLSQEMLENLPIPVIGVDNHYKLILTNDILRQTFSQFACSLPGAPLEEILTEAFFSEIKNSFEQNNAAELRLKRFELDGKVIEPIMNILGSENDKRGFVLAMNIINCT